MPKRAGHVLASFVVAPFLVATFLVGALLTGQGRILRVPGNFARLDQAVQAARDGDTILCSLGTEVGDKYRVSGIELTIQGTVAVANCRGSVLIEPPKLSFNDLVAAAVPPLTIRGSEQVWVKHSNIHGRPAIRVAQSGLLVS